LDVATSDVYFEQFTTSVRIKRSRKSWSFLSEAHRLDKCQSVAGLQFRLVIDHCNISDSRLCALWYVWDNITANI